MLICLCNGISDRHVRKAIVEGAETLEQIKEKLHIGTNCGCCLTKVKQLLESESDKKVENPCRQDAAFPHCKAI